MRTLLLLCLFALSGCTTAWIDVQKEYLTPDRYASVYVDTPDPRKLYPEVGERLYIYWKVPKNRWRENAYTLSVNLRYQNNEEEKECFQLFERKGCKLYEVKGDRFCEFGGFRTYLIELLKEDRPVFCWRHAIWGKRLTIEDEEFDFEEEELEEDWDIEEWDEE